MVTIVKEISTSQLKSQLNNIKKENVGFSNKNNLYVYLNGEHYLVLHNGQRIPSSSEFISKHKEILLKEINDEDVFNRLLTIATRGD